MKTLGKILRFTVDMVYVAVAVFILTTAYLEYQDSKEPPPTDDVLRYLI